MSVVGGSLFSLAVLVGLAQAGGRAVSLAGAPPLLGMLLAGILLNNMPYVGTHLG
jgi:Kef-type K+ transport system membrane component KefB